MSAAPYTLADLLTPQNLDAIRARFLSGLQGAGFPALTGWVPKAGVEMSFVDMVGTTTADKIAADLPEIVGSGFLGKQQTDAFADLLAESVYKNTRVPATKTTFNMELVSTATAPPNTWAVGDVEIVGPSGKRYRNTTAADGTPDSFVSMGFEAEAAGSSYADDPATCELVTTFAGVSLRPAAPAFSAVVALGSSTGRFTPTVTAGASAAAHTYTVRIDVTGDPGAARFSLDVDGTGYADGGLLRASTPLAGYGITLVCFSGAGSPASFIEGDTFVFTAPGGPARVPGADAESTPDLMARCRGRYATLSRNPTDGLFLLWARLAYSTASRVQVSPDLVVPGRTVLTIADSQGPIDPFGVARVTAYIAPKLGCVLDGVLVKSATAHTFGLTGYVLVDPSKADDVQEEAHQLFSLYTGRVAIGGVVRYSEVLDLLMDAGAIDVTGLNLVDGDGSGPTNIQLGTGEVAVAVDSLANMLQWIFA